MGIKGRPVSSIEEARATSIDFDGSVFYFPDLANKRIYTKQINMDGTSTLNVYEWKNEPVVNSPQYVTREEFEATLAQLKQDMSELSDDIVEMIEGASPEERQLLEKKMTTLINKVAQLNTNA